MNNLNTNTDCVGLLRQERGTRAVIDLNTGYVLKHIHKSELRRPFPFTKVYVPLQGGCFSCIAKENTSLCEKLGHCLGTRFVEGIYISKQQLAQLELIDKDWSLA